MMCFLCCSSPNRRGDFVPFFSFVGVPSILGLFIRVLLPLPANFVTSEGKTWTHRSLEFSSQSPTPCTERAQPRNSGPFTQVPCALEALALMMPGILRTGMGSSWLVCRTESAALQGLVCVCLSSPCSVCFISNTYGSHFYTQGNVGSH